MWIAGREQKREESNAWNSALVAAANQKRVEW